MAPHSTEAAAPARAPTRANALKRVRRLLPAAWLGLLVAVGAVAAPAPFAVLAAADAGRVNARIFAAEAWISVALALVLWFLERSRARKAARLAQGSVLSAEMVLLLVALLATVLGFFVVQAALPAARAGQGLWSFGALHAVSVACFALKAVAVAALAWRATR